MLACMAIVVKFAAAWKRDPILRLLTLMTPSKFCWD